MVGNSEVPVWRVREAFRQSRYKFGTTEGKISGERACKRRPAKHLDFLLSLLEGRRSIQLSYGRILGNSIISQHLCCYRNCLRCFFFGALWSIWNLKTDAHRLCFRQAKLQFLIQSGVKFWHRFRFVPHPEVVYVLLHTLTAQPSLAVVPKTVPTQASFVDSLCFEAGLAVQDARLRLNERRIVPSAAGF
jgi:hypothetical protein